MISSHRYAIGAAAALLVGCGSVSQLPIATPQVDTQFPPSSGSRAVNEAGRDLLVYALRPRDGESPYTLIYRKGVIFGENPDRR